MCVAHDLHRRGRVVRASNGLTTTPSGTCGSWREARTWRLAPSVLGLFVAQCSSVTCCRSCFSVSIKGQHTGELSPERSSPVFLCLLFIFFLGLLARVRARASKGECVSVECVFQSSANNAFLVEILSSSKSPNWTLWSFVLWFLALMLAFL